MTAVVVDYFVDSENEKRIGCGLRRFVVLWIWTKRVGLFYYPAMTTIEVDKRDFEKYARPVDFSARLAKKIAAIVRDHAKSNGGLTANAKKALAVLAAEKTVDQQQENEMRTSTNKTTKKPATKKSAQSERATTMPRKAAKKPDREVKAGSKLAIIVDLLTRPQGCTTADVLKATGWPAVSMPQQAKAAGLMLKKEKEDGVTRYRAA